MEEHSVSFELNLFFLVFKDVGTHRSKAALRCYDEKLHDITIKFSPEYKFTSRYILTQSKIRYTFFCTFSPFFVLFLFSSFVRPWFAKAKLPLNLDIGAWKVSEVEDPAVALDLLL